MLTLQQIHRSGQTADMDVVQAVSGYVSKMVSAGENASGTAGKMKILLLDDETVGTTWAFLKLRGGVS